MDDAANNTGWVGPGAVLRWLIRALALVGLVGSVLLTREALHGSALPGCGAGSGCADVFSSAWARWFGVPVALGAVGVYGVALGAACNIGAGRPASQRRLAWGVLAAAAVIALGAAVWFSAIQWLVVGRFCAYCTAVHVNGAVMAGLIAVAWRRVRDRCDGAQRRRALWPVFGALMLGVLILGQMVQPSGGMAVRTVAGGAQASGDYISLHGGQVRLTPEHLPHLGLGSGPADAERREATFAAYLFDYTCPHCRNVHHMLESARQRYGDRLVLITLPVPLDADCNARLTETEPRHEHACELATLALAVWRADRSQFERFDAWLFTDDTPEPRAARRFAEQLVGQAALQRAIDSGWPAQQIERNLRLHEVLGGGVIPRLVTASAQMVGQPHDAGDLYRVLEQETGLTPRAAATRPADSQPTTAPR